MSTPSRQFAVHVVQTLRDAGFEALWAGGCVRDLLLNLQPDDYDVATNAVPEQVRQLFGPRRTLAIGESFGVILVKAPRNSGAADVEVATFRTEGPYLDGRRPESVVFCSPEEDAKRRDFTINGMFYDPLTETVFDYVGGQADLQARRVRAIGDPHARFGEDKLRMLRAVRMTAKFNFTLDEPTARAIREMAREILVVSQERIAQELRKMLVHPGRAKAMQLAAQVQVLQVILPECESISVNVSANSEHVLLRRLANLQSPPFELPMALLLADAEPTTVDACCRRLRLSNDEREGIMWLVQNQHSLTNAAELRLSRLKRLVVHPQIRDLIALSRAVDVADGREPVDAAFIENYLRSTPPGEIDPPPLLTGNDLKTAGLKPGPDFKALLDAVRAAQLEGDLETSEEALELVRKLRSGVNE